MHPYARNAVEDTPDHCRCLENATRARCSYLDFQKSEKSPSDDWFGVTPAKCKFTFTFAAILGTVLVRTPMEVLRIATTKANQGLSTCSLPSGSENDASCAESPITRSRKLYILDYTQPVSSHITGVFCRASRANHPWLLVALPALGENCDMPNSFGKERDMSQSENTNTEKARNSQPIYPDSRQILDVESDKRSS